MYANSAIVRCAPSRNPVLLIRDAKANREYLNDVYELVLERLARIKEEKSFDRKNAEQLLMTVRMLIEAKETQAEADY